MQKVVPHLWFDREAKEAARFYTAVFPAAIRGPLLQVHAGDLLHGFLLMYCDTQAEIDYYLGRLSAFSEHEQRGWLKDKFDLAELPSACR